MTASSINMRFSNGFLESPQQADDLETQDGTRQRRGVGAPAGGLGEREPARGAARTGATLQHALALERAQVIEGGARGDAELLTDLTHGGRHAVATGEGPDEVQHVSLPGGQLSHARPVPPGRNSTQPLLSKSSE